MTIEELLKWLDALALSPAYYTGKEDLTLTISVDEARLLLKYIESLKAAKMDSG